MYNCHIMLPMSHVNESQKVLKSVQEMCTLFGFHVETMLVYRLIPFRVVHVETMVPSEWFPLAHLDYREQTLGCSFLLYSFDCNSFFFKVFNHRLQYC